ncbi:MAG: hypothetical protein KDB07_04820, partial [Planctomycetes bacterium]|nr:hypothetical protein [Planctomycetota bacterium]
MSEQSGQFIRLRRNTRIHQPVVLGLLTLVIWVCVLSLGANGRVLSEGAKFPAKDKVASDEVHAHVLLTSDANVYQSVSEKDWLKGLEGSNASAELLEDDSTRALQYVSTFLAGGTVRFIGVGKSGGADDIVMLPALNDTKGANFLWDAKATAAGPLYVRDIYASLALLHLQNLDLKEESLMGAITALNPSPGLLDSASLYLALQSESDVKAERWMRLFDVSARIPPGPRSFLFCALLQKIPEVRSVLGRWLTQNRASQVPLLQQQIENVLWLSQQHKKTRTLSESAFPKLDWSIASSIMDSEKNSASYSVLANMHPAAVTLPVDHTGSSVTNDFARYPRWVDRSVLAIRSSLRFTSSLFTEDAFPFVRRTVSERYGETLVALSESGMGDAERPNSSLLLLHESLKSAGGNWCSPSYFLDSRFSPTTGSISFWGVRDTGFDQVPLSCDIMHGNIRALCSLADETTKSSTTTKDQKEYVELVKASRQRRQKSEVSTIIETLRSTLESQQNKRKKEVVSELLSALFENRSAIHAQFTEVERVSIGISVRALAAQEGLESSVECRTLASVLLGDIATDF